VTPLLASVVLTTTLDWKWKNQILIDSSATHRQFNSSQLNVIFLQNGRSYVKFVSLRPQFMDKSKKSRSLSLSLSSSPKLKTRHYKTTIFSQNSKTKQTKTLKGGFIIHSFLFDFFPSSNSVFAQCGLITDLESWTRREEKRREEKSSPYFELCVVPCRPRKQRPQVWERLFSCPSSFLLIMAKFGAQSVSFFPSSRFGIGQILYT